MGERQGGKKIVTEYLEMSENVKKILNIQIFSKMSKKCQKMTKKCKINLKMTKNIKKYQNVKEDASLYATRYLFRVFESFQEFLRVLKNLRVKVLRVFESL